MTTKTTTVTDLMADSLLTSEHLSDVFALSVTYKHWQNDGTEAETPYTFTMTKQDVMQLIHLNWGPWSFVWYEDGIPIAFDSDISVQAFAQFCRQFSGYKTRCLVNLQRQLEAYFADYNPIENYNGNETEDETVDEDNPHKSVKEISGYVRNAARVKGYDAAGGDIQVSESGGSYTTSIEAQQGWTPVATHSETAYDTTALKPVATDSATMAAGTTMTQADEGNNFTHWDDYQETTTEEGSRLKKLNRHGNMGVTMTQQMIEAEIATRSRDLVKGWLKKFIDENCVLTVPDVCSIEGM